MVKFFQQRTIQILVIVVLTSLAYSNIFQNDFVSDDRGFILRWAVGKNISDIPKVIAGDGPPFRKEATWRPVRDTLYVIYGQIFGKNTFGWHLHSLVVHLGVTVLVYLIIESLISADSRIHSRSEVKSSSGEHFGSVTRVERTGADNRLSSRSASWRRSDLRQEIASPATPRNDISRWLPFFAALMFGLHPVHTESITFMTSSMDMIGPLFMFASFAAYLYANRQSPAVLDKSAGLRMRISNMRMDANKEKLVRIVSVGLATLAFFSYEMTLVLPVLLILYDWTLGRGTEGQRDKVNRGYKGRETVTLSTLFTLSLSPFVTKFLPYFAAALGYVLIRVFLVGRVPGGMSYWIDNTSFNWSRFMEPEVILKYLKILFFPINLSFNHVIRPGFDTFLAWVNDPKVFDNYQLWPVFLALFLMLTAIFAAVRFRNKMPLLSFGILWFLAAQMPFANIIGQPAIMAERYIYIASFGFIIFVLNIILLIPKILANLVIVFLLVFWGTLTFLRNSDWKDGVSIWRSVVAVYPESALGYNNIGKEYVDKKEYELAVPLYQAALELRPRYFYASNDLAITFYNLDKLDLALAQYKKTLAINENYIQSYLGLGQLYRKLKRNDLALAALERALLVKVANTPLTDEGFSILQSDIYNDLGITLKEQGKVKDAMDAFVKALELDSKSQIAQKNFRDIIINNPSLWMREETESGSFSYPQFWEIVDQGEKYTLISEDRHFRVEIGFSRFEGSVNSYLAKKEDNYGSLVSKESLDLPSFDRSYAKVWKDQASHKIQFLLFKNRKVVEILAYPSESELKPIVDGIISTIEIE